MSVQFIKESRFGVSDHECIQGITEIIGDKTQLDVGQRKLKEDE